MKKCVSAAALRAPLFMALLVCADISVVRAQSIPAPWTAGDVGSPSPTGSSTYSSGVFTVNAGGADIWGTSDQFRFIYQRLTGDAEIIARVDSLTAADSWTKAGVMIRDSLSANAAHGYVMVSPLNGVWFNRRTASGGVSTTTAGPAGGAPVWLRATRVGTRVTTYYSTTGTSWTTIGYDTIALGSSAYFGLAVTSHNTSALTTANLSNVTLVGGGSTGAALPAGQTGADIGGPAIAGSSTYAAGTYTVKAAGVDIWGTADQFRFVYQPVTGDVEIVARVASITRQHSWSKTGVMVRESLTAASRHASTFTSSSKGYAFQRRPETGGYSVHTSGDSGTAPGWVRLVRTGDLFESYSSANGTTWTKIGSDTIAMGDTVYVGLAATSHNVDAATVAVLDSVKITASGTTNQSPSVSLTAPLNGTLITAPATVTLTATASDPEIRMASVDFYAGSTLVLRDTTAPYSASWSATSAGTVALTAVAHDADGGSTTSGTVNVTVLTGTASTLPKAVAFKASTDHATNVTNYVFKVFAAGVNTAIATPLATSDLGKPAPTSTGDITVDRSAFFSALAVGNYVATVTAVGPGGHTPSTSVTFTR